MTESRLPTNNGSEDDTQVPEVRLELTQAGVRQVLSLYAEEQAGRGGLQLTLADIARIAMERKGTVAIGLLAGCLLSGLVLAVTTPIFAVSAQVVLERTDPLDSALSDGTAGSAWIATQAEIMQSRSVVAGAVASLGGISARVAERVGDADEPLPDPVAEALEWLQASPISGTQVVALSYLGPDANYGAELLAATVAAYRHRLIELEQHNQALRLKAKEAEYAALIEEIRAVEDRLDETRRQTLGGVSAADAVDRQNQLLDDQAERLADVRQERIALQSQLLAGSLDSLADDPVGRDLKDRLLLAEADLARAAQTLTAGHPTREAAQREVDLLRAQLATAERATPLALEREIAALQRLEAELADVLQAERQALADAERLRRDEQVLIDELEQTQALIDDRRSALVDQRLSARLANSGEIGITARLIAEPVVPLVPTWPNSLLVLILGACVGLLAGIGWAVVSERAARVRWLGADDGLRSSSA